MTIEQDNEAAFEPPIDRRVVLDVVARLRERAARKWTDDANRSASLFGQAADEIERLRSTLTEARRWIGDGEFSDGLHHDYWTPEYKAAVAMVDAALVVPNA